MTHWIRIFRIGLGLAFLLAGVTKLIPPGHRLLFEMAVSAHGVLPAEGVIVAAWLIPLFEIALGTLLVWGWKPHLTATVASLTLLVFFGFMASAYSHGIQSYCGCFGFGEPISAATLARDGGLLAIALILTGLASWRRPGRAGETAAQASRVDPSWASDQ